MAILPRCPRPSHPLVGLRCPSRRPLLGAVASALVGSACQGAGGGPGVPRLPSVVDPASPNAAALASFTWLLHAIMALVFTGVLATLLYVAWRFRARPDREPRLIFGNTRLEIGWTVAPALVVLAAFLLSLYLITTVDAPPSAAGAATESAGPPLNVVAIGRQWWWEYQLLEHGVVTANELHLPLGRPVRLELRADDVIHAWWVPQLSGKRDMIPGIANVLWFTPLQAGVFGGACAEFCGIQHAWMRIRVVVESPQEFQTWLEQQARPAAPPRSPEAQRGEQLFTAVGCAACHAINGRVQATAEAGPNLTHLASRATLGAGVLENTPENLARWLRNPQDVKPGNSMPATALTSDQVAALTAYLTELR